MRAHPKCPCLREGVVTTCAADTEAVRIPTQFYVARICVTDLHRRCEVFRRFRGVRLAKPRESREGA
jgi:hypothetical protein